jgi:hypothetical protein
LTREDALAKVRELYGEDAMGAAEVAASLVSSARGWLGAVDPIVDRPTWIVHMSGMGIVRSGPPEADGTTAPSVVIDHRYVFIAADSGEYLGSIWTE